MPSAPFDVVMGMTLIVPENSFSEQSAQTVSVMTAGDIPVSARSTVSLGVLRGFFLEAAKIRMNSSVIPGLRVQQPGWDLEHDSIVGSLLSYQ